MSSKTIQVNYLARVEGEGGLYIRIKDGQLRETKLKIFEPPRFFEAFLRGRMYHEAPDITARICGICPIAYQTSAAQAMESAFGVRVEGQLRQLRRLIFCGEWIESHVLHIYMLHAPDFLGYQDAIQMAKKFPTEVKRGLALKKVGNDLMTIIGGREIHPVNPKVGGFYKVPAKKDFIAITERLKWAKEAAIETIRLTAGFEFPAFEQDYEYVALRHPDEYAITEGRLVSNKGLDIAIQEFEEHFQEEHVAHSTSLHAVHKGYGAYLVGPLARYNLNFDKLTPLCKEEAKSAGVLPECKNPFKSIVIRSIETLYAVEESLRLIEQYEPPEHPSIEVQPRRSTGCGCSEAPRGICYHRYRLDDKGVIVDAKIVPPTSQNQKMIEEDLKKLVPDHLELPQDDLTWLCEQMVRNYDPCISCSCHFLKMTVDRE